jgi:hypothetical protein
MITDREFLAVCHAYFISVMTICLVQSMKGDAVQFFKGNKAPRLREMERLHSHQLMALTWTHYNDVLQLQAKINTADNKYIRLSTDYDWLSTKYEDQTHLVQELEDRVAYLEGKLHEAGQTTPTTRQPYSAPPTQMEFTNPPHRSRASTIVSPSPLSDVSILPDSYRETSTDFR